MSATELKLQIINKVIAITDERILEEIFKLVTLESEMDSLYKLTDSEKKAIEVGLEDIKEGRTF